MMESTTTHKAFSNLDARDPLYIIIKSFFESTTNQRKFSTAYKEFTTKIQHDDFARTKKIFDVLDKTDITTKKEVMRRESKQGLFYLIERKLLQTVERDRRKEKREGQVTTIIEQNHDTKSDPPSTENSYSILDSDENIETTSTEPKRTLPKYKTPIKNPYKKDTTMNIGNNEGPNNTTGISPDLLDLAKTLEAEAKAQIEEITNTDEEHGNYHETIKHLIDNATAETIATMEEKVRELETKIKTVETIESTGKKYNEKLNNRLCYFNNKFNEIETKVNKTIRQCEEKLTMINTLMEDEFEELNSKVHKRIKEMDNKIHNLTTLTPNLETGHGNLPRKLDEMSRQLQHLQEQHKERVDKLSKKTKIIMDSFIEQSNNALDDLQRT